MFDVPEVGPQGGPETLTLEDLGDRTLMRAVSHMGLPRWSTRRWARAWSRGPSRPGIAWTRSSPSA